MHWMDYGARWYNPQINQWGQVDPLAEKFYAWSGYNYVLGNPVRLIDPDGREIWLPLSNGNKVRYSEGALYNSDGSKYNGDDAFVSKASASLNNLYSTANGKAMLNALTTSDVKFNINNTFYEKNGQPLKDVLSYDGIKGGEANINAGTLMVGLMSEGQEIEALAHELFHGFQDLNGETGATINREVGAYLFGRSTAITLGYGMLGFGGDEYDGAMSDLLFGTEFTQTDYDKALETFKTQSSVNSNGIYNNFKVIAPDTNPQIKQFFPLLKD